jgi:ATP-binding cassette subfamily B protein
MISSDVTSPILRLTQLWQNFQETGLSLERSADIVDTPQEAELDSENIRHALIKGTCHLRKPGFPLQSHGRLQLYNVNLESPRLDFRRFGGRKCALGKVPSLNY